MPAGRSRILAVPFYPSLPYSLRVRTLASAPTTDDSVSGWQLLWSTAFLSTQPTDISTWVSILIPQSLGGSLNLELGWQLTSSSLHALSTEVTGLFGPG